MVDNNDSSQFDESILAKELYDLCEADSLSEEGLREIIERYGLNDTRHVGIITVIFRVMCVIERVTEGILRYLLNIFPAAAMATDNEGQLPLHLACQNPNMTLNIIQLIIDAAPDSVRQADINGRVPLHHLCMVDDCVDEISAIEILKLLLHKYPEAARHADDENGTLPIHIACGYKSPEFCRVLIEAYPGSERITDASGELPLHFACWKNTIATVEYLYKLYPDSINHTPTSDPPIASAVMGMNDRENPTVAVEIVKFLLDCDPSVALQEFKESSLLLLSCLCGPEHYNDSNIETALEIFRVIYDAHPEAIVDITFVLNIHRFHQQIQTFIDIQLVFARQARDHRQMTAPDEKGQLPLHTALQNNVRLGSIKLLMKGNPLAAQSPDNSGALPLHVACEHHDSPRVVQYLIGLDTTTLDAVDRDGNTALHYACRSAQYDMIRLLLDKYDAVSVSKRNAQKKLPIDLLWESNEVLDRGSIEHTESVFRLLKAYPEIVMNIDMNISAADPSQNGKKRKFDNA
eukprot:scaffold12609_cov132-Skeletonema_dohrnii-CCMP3373.AAC.7